MLDPDRLLDKIDGLRAARAAHADELPADQRLPDTHFDDLAGAIEDEGTDPHRVTRATSMSSPDGRQAPPPVIYLSRKPSVSQFMTVISDCFEQELEGPAAQGLLHLGDLAHLEQSM